MSGHSHYATIKHKKALTDAKRSKVFSKMAKALSIAAREKGGDPESNPTLRTMIEKARDLNMPRDNIERAIKKGSGELSGEILENITLEALGPGGIAMIIEGITDNKNRSLGEIKKILSEHNAKLAGEGAVKWLFERKGVIKIKLDAPNANKDDLEMLAIEAGADDLAESEEGFMDVYTKSEDLDKVKRALEEGGVKIEDASLGWIEKESIVLDEKEKTKYENIFEALDESDAVQNIYSNLKL